MTKPDAVRDWRAFQDIFVGWCNACSTRAEMEADKQLFTGWSTQLFSRGRKEDRAKRLPAIPPDEQIVWMGDLFAKRYKELP